MAADFESASSGLTVTYTSSNTDVATVSGSTITIVGAGTSTITASQAGNDDYNAASDVEQVLTVGKADQTITFTTLDNKTYGDAVMVLVPAPTMVIVLPDTVATSVLLLVCYRKSCGRKYR